MMDEATVAKRRIEACLAQAQINARSTNGDAATAAADLMCAFVLLTVKSGADPDRAREAMWENAKACVADFWPADKIN